MIRGIVFDCFGVLAHGSLEYLRGITPRENRPELDDLCHASDYGYISQREFAERAGELTGRSAEEIVAITNQQLIRSKAMTECLESLHKNYKTALLSNVGRGMIDGLFTSEEQQNLFDAIVVSSDVGMVKPNAEIYQLTAERLGLLPDECVMIDDIPINVQGAEAAGMYGFLFKDAEGFEADIRKFIGENNA